METLREDGVSLPQPIPKPAFKAASDHGAAAFRINNNSLIKVWREGDERTRPASWGYHSVDRDADWVIGWWTDGPNARQQAHAIARVVERVLELYRIDPQTDWDLVDGWRTRTLQDWPQEQQWATSFHLSQRGRLLRTAVHRPNP